MPTHTGHTIEVTTDQSKPIPPPRPAVTQLNPSLKATNNVLELTSLNTNGGQPARIANLNYANVISNTNLSGQNAVANQQAHSQLALSITGKVANRAQNLSPIEARASVDVLTDNGLADEIASLRATVEAFGGGGGIIPRPIPPHRLVVLLRALRHMLRELLHIVKVNSRLQGTGTLLDPYVVVDSGSIYLVAPMTVGFPGLQPDQVKITPTKDGIVEIGG